MRKLILFIFSIILCIGCKEQASKNNDLALLTEGKAKEKESSIIESKNTNSSILNEWQEGDIIFQSSLSSQSKAIQLATNSRYSHMGIIFREKGEWYVYEAIQPVQMTKLENWIDRGEADHFVVKRLRKYPQGMSSLEKESLKESGQKYKGKDYDLYFNWGNESIYCSELIWKMYQEGLGITLCELKQLEEFDLNNEIVQSKLEERYGDRIPLNEKVVSPEDIFQSELLVEVEINEN